MNPRKKTLLIQISLFLITLLTTTLSGAEWIHGSSFYFSSDKMGWHEFLKGFQFSIPFLGILTIHEFGHYFTARKHKTRVTLPYYIPLWLPWLTSIGTMGAFIRIKQQLKSRIKFFDIGIAGPLAGFVAALFVLYFGFKFLPPIDYIFEIFPQFKQFGSNFPLMMQADKNYGAVILGDNLLFDFFKTHVADPARLPHAFVMTNYPVLLAGYLALFFTSLNLIPIGQLDGGHILYGLIGDKAFRIVSPILFIAFAFYSGLGMFSFYDFQTLNNDQFLEKATYFLVFIYFNYLCCSKITQNRNTNWLIAISIVAVQLIVSYLFPTIQGYSGFLAFVFMLGRFLGIYHPATTDAKPLSLGRQILGWLALIIFLISFSPKPFEFV
jgi:membrane-associated protease RseP (regulator of RpoE activity)